MPGANTDRNGELYLQTWKPAQFPAAPTHALGPQGRGKDAANAAAHRMRVPPV